MNKINQKELHSLFIGIKKGKELEFNQLYEKYKSLVYAISFSILKKKEDSEEIMQTVFLKIFQLEKEKLPNQNEASWLYTITKNEAISFFRKRKETITLDAIYQIEDDCNEIDKTIEKIKFNQLIHKLTDTEKEIISLKMVSKLSFREISKLLNQPLGTIKWRYYRAVDSLKILLGNLAMFVATFLIGLSKIKKKEKHAKEENQQEESENETKQEEQKKEDLDSEKAEEQINGVIQETIVETEKTFQEEKPYFTIGVFSISAIFLIFTIIFLIFFLKYRLKHVAKSSKE